MPRQIRSQAYCIDGVLDVDWDISPIEDMFFIRDGVALGIDQRRAIEAVLLSIALPEEILSFPSK